MLIGAVGLLDRAGLHQAQIGAAAGLGQAHRARPFAGDHLGNDVLLHPRRTRRDQRAVGGAPVRPGYIAKDWLADVRHLGDGHGDERAAGSRRRIRSARRARSSRASAIGLVGFLEALGRAHDAVLEMAAFLVAGLVEGLQHLLAELRGVASRMSSISVRRQVGELRQVALLFDLQKLVASQSDNRRPARDRRA